MQAPGSMGGIHYTAAAAEASSRMPSEIEREVLSLFEEFRAPLIRYTLAFGVQVHHAEEIVQETFLSLFRHLQMGKSKKNLRGWIFRVAHNLALKHRNVTRRLGEVPDPDSVLDLQADPMPNPEQLASFAQRRIRLLSVVAAIPEVDQSCLRLRAEGLRYREIAAVLGISLGSVSISLTRTLARLARAEGR